MRRSRVAALLSAAAFAVSAKVASADTNLFVTEADFGGSAYAPMGTNPIPAAYVGNPLGHTYDPNYNVNTNSPGAQATQTNWLGIGTYNSATSGTGGGTVDDTDSLGNTVSYSNTSLGGVNITSNGLGNFDDFNPATGTGHTPDANLGTSWANLSSPTGSMIINNYQGRERIVTWRLRLCEYG